MNPSSPFPISDELLSAYIDGDVSPAEKQQIEFAIATDPKVAWQVETLRQTVALLREMPPIPLPRSFALKEEQVADTLQARRAAVRSATRTDDPSFWQRLLGFFSTGNLALRNASALAAMLFVIITVSRAFVASGPMTPMVAQPDQAAMFEAAPAAAPAAPDEPAPSLMMATGEDEEPGIIESQAADAGAINTTESAMPAAAARSMPASEEQGATEAPAAPPAPLQTAAFQTEPVAEEPAQENPDVVALRVMPLEEDEPEPQAVPEAAAAMAAPPMEATQMGAPEMGIARVAPASEDEASAAGTSAVEDAAVEEMSAETFAADAALAEPDLATKSTTEDVPEIESSAVELMDEPADMMPPTEPQDSTISMAEEGAASRVEVAPLIVEPAESTTVSPDVWQIMQIGVLVLALILWLLWLGSRQRSSRSPRQ
ncbi:MAG: hypothetical protein KF893_07960 [Caldilineaceae bacterium]|nr:hypothetical protein [Caldilineaceae bacterium]